MGGDPAPQGSDDDRVPDDLFAPTPPPTAAPRRSTSVPRSAGEATPDIDDVGPLRSSAAARGCADGRDGRGEGDSDRHRRPGVPDAAELLPVSRRSGADVGPAVASTGHRCADAGALRCRPRRTRAAQPASGRDAAAGRSRASRRGAAASAGSAGAGRRSPRRRPCRRAERRSSRRRRAAPRSPARCAADALRRTAPRRCARAAGAESAPTPRRSPPIVAPPPVTPPPAARRPARSSGAAAGRRAADVAQPDPRRCAAAADCRSASSGLDRLLRLASARGASTLYLSSRRAPVGPGGRRNPDARRRAVARTERRRVAAADADARAQPRSAAHAARRASGFAISTTSAACAA